MDGCRVKDMAERVPPDAPLFQLIVDNEYRVLGGAAAASPSGGSAGRSPFLEEVFPCECRYHEGTSALLVC